MTCKLHIFPGSPFARMARIMVHEFDLPVEVVTHGFPPGPELFDFNPLGQVPVLETGDGPVFPTLLVIETLWQMAGAPAAFFRPADRQRLLVTLQAGDALVSALYQRWSGLGPVGPNQVGYDPAERNLKRFFRVLDMWEAERPGPDLTASLVALGCLLMWCDARPSPPWRHRTHLAATVDALAARPSFRATRPQPWPAD